MFEMTQGNSVAHNRPISVTPIDLTNINDSSDEMMINSTSSEAISNVDNNNNEGPEIYIPGSFVVLQGISGDGMSNTIDTFPIVYENDNDNNNTSNNTTMATATTISTTATSTTIASVAVTSATASANDYDNDDSDNDEIMIDSMKNEPAPIKSTSYNLDEDRKKKAKRKATETIDEAPTTSSSSSSSDDSYIVVEGTNNNNSNNKQRSLGKSNINNGHNSNSSLVLDENEDQQQQQQEQQNNNNNMSISEQRAIERWHNECRHREVEDRLEEWNFGGGSSGSSSNNNGNNDQQLLNDQMWYQDNGKLCIMSSLPVRSSINRDLVKRHIIGTLSPGSTIVGTELILLNSSTLNPIRCSSSNLDSNNNNNNNNDNNNKNSNNIIYPKGKLGEIQIIKIESPKVGYVVLSIDGYILLGPGLPTSYVNPSNWMWRVTCSDGAYVRNGLELTSNHVITLPYGSFVRVVKKTINSMGLARLRIIANVNDSNNNVSGRSSSKKSNSNNNIVEGWISESLNPLSGQRGPIVQPLPFPVPALYRVTLESGAVILSDIELSSSEIGFAPYGSILKIIGRVYSDHPMDCCIERLKLAGCGGWVSTRLNRPPPHNDIVLQMISIDGTFDPDNPGRYHINSYKQVQNEHSNSSNHNNISDSDIGNDLLPNNSQRNQHRRMSSFGQVSSINEDDDDNYRSRRSSMASSMSSVVSESTAATGQQQQQQQQQQQEEQQSTPNSSSSPAPILFRSGIATSLYGQQQQLSSAFSSSILPPFGGGAGTASGISSDNNSVSSNGNNNNNSSGQLQPMSSHQQIMMKDEKCLICLTSDRNSTIVHGETGHIACCLPCARILKARGDRCPVCRLPIDLVIQQFWA